MIPYFAFQIASSSNISDERTAVLWEQFVSHGITALDHTRLLKCLFFVMCSQGIKAVLDALQFIYQNNVTRIRRKMVPQVKIAYAIDYLNSMSDRDAGLVLLNALVSTLKDIETLRNVTKILMKDIPSGERKHKFINYR